MTSKNLETTYLGNLEPTASEIISALEDAGIEWWAKNRGMFSLPIGEFSGCVCSSTRSGSPKLARSPIAS